MPLPLAIAAIVKGLAANGLATLAGAVAAKGKEWVEDKIGIKIPDDASGLTGDKLLELKKAEMAHEEVLINAALEEKRMELDAEKHAGTQVTDRWKADMSSDSWLSKNIRPLALCWLLVNLTGIVIADGAGVDFKTGTLALIEMALSIVLAAYFVGRSVEKGVSVVQRYKSMREVRGGAST
jgi:hypothetical protein